MPSIKTQVVGWFEMDHPLTAQTHARFGKPCLWSDLTGICSGSVEPTLAASATAGGWRRRLSDAPAATRRVISSGRLRSTVVLDANLPRLVSELREELRQFTERAARQSGQR